MSSIGYATMDVIPTMRGAWSKFQREINSGTDSATRKMREKFARESSSAGRQAGENVARGLRTADYGRAGAEGGSRFSRAFSAAVRIGMLGVGASFSFARGHVSEIVKHVGKAAIALKVASVVARGFSRSLLASGVAMRMLGGAGLGRLAGGLRVVAAIAGRVARDIGRVTAAFLVLRAVASVVGTLTRISRVLGMLTIGGAVAGGAIAALASVVGSFATGPMVAGLTAAAAALGTVAAAAAGILGPAAAVAGLAFKGLSDGAKAFMDAQKNVGATADKSASALRAVDQAKKAQSRTAEQGNRQIVQSEKQVADAQVDVLRAQDDVNAARREARRDAAGYARSLNGLANDEEGARLALAEANAAMTETNSRSDASATDRWRAQFGVKEAKQALDEVLANNAEQTQKIKAAQAAGVEGSDVVVAAKEREQSASEALTDAEANREQTQKDVAQANIDAAEAVTDAYRSMAEAQQSAAAAADPFAAMIGQRMAPLLTSFKALRQEVTDRFSGALVGAFSTTGGLLDTLRPKLGGLSTVLGGIGTQIATSISSPAATAGWQSMIASSSQFFTGLSQGESGLGSIAAGLISVVSKAASLFANKGQQVNQFLLGLGNRLKNITADDLKASLDKVIGAFRTVSGVVGPIFSVLSKFGATSASGLAPGFRSMGQAISDATPGMMQMADKLMPAIGQAMSNIAPLIPALVHAFQPWATILAAVAPPLATVISHLGPMGPILVGAAIAVKGIMIATTLWNALMFANSVALGISSAAIGVNSAALQGNRIAQVSNIIATRAFTAASAIGTGVMKLGTLATKAGAIAMRLFGAALRFAMGPIGLIITAVTLIAAGLVLLYQKNETFRNMVQAVWSGIKTAIGAVWNWLSTVVWPGFKAALAAVGNAAMWLWNNAIKPAWSGIQAAIGIAWNIIQGYFNMWRFIIMDVVVPAVMWLWHNVVEPAFQGIGAVIGFVWGSVISPAFDLLKAGVSAIGGAFSFLWNSVIKPVWDALGAGIKFVFDNVLSPTFEALKRAVGFVGDTFSTIVEAIRTVWDKIKEYTRKPVEFVVNTVWNNGLRAVWDKLDDFLPIPKAPAPVKFAEGGQVPMMSGARRGKDSVSALMMPGEHVWDVADVNKSGGQSTQYRMRSMVEQGKPFTWTPGGLAAAGMSADGAIKRFAEGGAVGPGAKLDPLPGEVGLQDIAKLMGRLITKMWPKGVKNIGGWRPPDGYNEHSSGRALDVMINDSKTGDQVKDWSMANSKNYPMNWAIWKQKMWYPPNGRSEGMPDRGTPTQNHMDHDHLFYKEQSVDPNRVPGNLVGFDGSGAGDGMSAGDKKSWLMRKAEEVINNLMGGIKDAAGGLFPGGSTVFQNLPKQFLDGTFGKMLDKARDVVAKIADPGFWYDKGKNLLGSVTKSVWSGAKKVGGLFRDQGGYVPTGQSVVTNETGKPEAVLNWSQLAQVRDMMVKGQTMSQALAQVGAAKPTSDTIPPGAVVLKNTATVDEVKSAAQQLQTAADQQQTTTPGSPNTSGAAAAGQTASSMMSLKELGSAAGGILAEGLAETFDLPSFITDPASAFKGDDGSNVRSGGATSSVTSQGAATGNSALSAPSTATPGTADPYAAANTGGVSFQSQQSKVGEVPGAAGPAGMPQITYKPGGGAEQWRPLAQWAIDFANKTMKGPAQLQAMVEQIGDESSGNPRAQNNDDINAQNGVPSGGLLQVIQPTFERWRDQRLANDRFDPPANLVAALNYYVGNGYGTDLTARWGHGKGGYKLGGYTGNFGVNDIAGFVHGREFVTGAAGTRKNMDLLEVINSGADVQGALVSAGQQWGSVAAQAPRQPVTAGRGGNRTTNIVVHGNTAGDIAQEIGRKEWRGSGGYGSRER